MIVLIAKSTHVISLTALIFVLHITIYDNIGPFKKQQQEPDMREMLLWIAAQEFLMNYVAQMTSNYQNLVLRRIWNLELELVTNCDVVFIRWNE
jgi:hypothetical protein